MIQRIDNTIVNGGLYKLPRMVVPKNLNGGIFDTDLSVFMCYLCKLTYGFQTDNDYVEAKPSNFDFVNVYLEQRLPIGVKIIKPLVYNCRNVSGWSNRWGGFIFEWKNASFICLRGSANVCDFYEDGKQNKTSALWLPKDSPALIHTGFNNMYTNEIRWGVKTLRDQIWDYFSSFSKTEFLKRRWYVTGHSLGAALSSVLAADISVNNKELRSVMEFYNFAPPCIGNADLVKIIMDASYRDGNYIGIFGIINYYDPVPTAFSGYRYIPTQIFEFSWNRCLL